LIENEYWGLYNCVCGGQTSRLEVAEELLRILGMEDKIEINSVDSDYFKETYYAERPPSERLITKKLDLRKVNKMRDWKVSLKEYINEYYVGYLNE
jgi:dTDP-4-dehydrorhamnose reductase